MRPQRMIRINMPNAGVEIVAEARISRFRSAIPHDLEAIYKASGP